MSTRGPFNVWLPEIIQPSPDRDKQIVLFPIGNSIKLTMIVVRENRGPIDAGVGMEYWKNSSPPLQTVFAPWPDSVEGIDRSGLLELPKNAVVGGEYGGIISGKINGLHMIPSPPRPRRFPPLWVTPYKDEITPVTCSTQTCPLVEVTMFPLFPTTTNLPFPQVPPRK